MDLRARVSFAGLDRYLRIWDTKTRQLLSAVCLAFMFQYIELNEIEYRLS